MIISKTPLRVSLTGGGTDFAFFYKKYDSFIVSFAIKKYIYIFLNNKFENDIRLIYSKNERIENINNINHPIFRNCLKEFNLRKNIEIATLADVPKGTGLGSSSSFTVGLLNCLNTLKKIKANKQQLAEQACKIEINKCKTPIGKQDQYAASYGNFNFINFTSNNNVIVKKIKLNEKKILSLSKNFFLVYTGTSRNSYKILKKQVDNIKIEKKKIDILKKMSDLSLELKKQLEKGDFNNIGEILDYSWLLKKQLNNNVSNYKIDYLYNLSKKNGADGAKLLGAGNGGFLLVYSNQNKIYNLKKTFKDYKVMDIEICTEGSQIIYNNNL
jgi:D-glycero-alpha-D-manno-heptose-7-phosphate kinase